MSPVVRARLATAAVHLPSRYRTMEEARTRIARSGSAFVPPVGLLEDLTGVRGVHEKAESEQASDLAVAAATKALESAGCAIGDVDLLLFTACSQDLIEPATAHIVAAKLGATCPALDVKNACNSVLNGIEIASAFIEAGRYGTVLITCGEACTLAARWDVPSYDAFLRAMPGYTISDAGAALLLTATPVTDGGPGILKATFGADSSAWSACTLAAGGTMHHRLNDPEATYLRLNGDLLRDIVLDFLPNALEYWGADADDARRSAFIAFHQTSVAQYHEVIEKLGLPPYRCLPTVAEHGNTASASLPLQLVTAMESNRLERGDTVTLIGLASGLSAGLVLIRL
ncbi:3-oxoacyl-ACP synthase III family protein [Streptomyces aureocirculatus]|uniref:3-oxoacyl-ACP synthase III family protein n=1 Tax=Streptomyces aureocirculatus TaxID=67275 RepID=UPI0004C629C2|nr:3-oxoacyl-[acyl-carrier-protein] synthase III C-terminal domain-containing protein [Streptomyces aureocirculatus]